MSFNQSTPYYGTVNQDSAVINMRDTEQDEFVEDEVTSEADPLIPGQPLAVQSCYCNACPSCFTTVWAKFSKSWPCQIGLAAGGAATALNGSLKAHEMYFSNFPYNVVMSLAAWAMATGVNFTASPVSSAKLMLEQGELLSIGPACSGIAAICSGFLATVAPVKIANIILQIFGSATITSVGWPLIFAGIFILVINTYTSWNVGNMATAGFLNDMPEIQQHLRDHKVRAICAIICALIMNLAVTAPYLDGIADSIAGMSTHEGDMLSRFQYLFFGSAGAAIDNTTLYKILYWGIFGGCLPANLVALTTFTFGPSYRFFYGLFSIFDTLHEKLTNHFQATGLMARVEEDSWGTWFLVIILTSLFTFAYGAAFGGFTAGTLTSANWEWTGLEKDTGMIVGFTATALTWGPTLFQIGKNIMRPPKEMRSKYYVMIQEYLTFLNDYETIPERTQRCLTIIEGLPTRIDTIRGMPTRNRANIYAKGQYIQGEILYRTKSDGVLVKTVRTVSPDVRSRHDMIELMSQFFSNETLMECYKRSMDKLKAGKDEGRVICHAPEKTFSLENPDRRIDVPQVVVSCDASYQPKGKIRLRIYLSAARPADFTLNLSALMDDSTL